MGLPFHASQYFDCIYAGVLRVSLMPPTDLPVLARLGPFRLIVGRLTSRCQIPWRPCQLRSEFNTS
jgi:hypothetical protein